VVGLFGCPTVVNNVETLAAVPAIFQKGADWFAKLGPEKSGGTRMVCLSGSVNRPGVFEVMLSTTVRELIESQDFGQGMPPGRKVKAVIPGGSSAPVLAADEIDVALEFEALKAVQNMAGSGGVIVMDDSTCLVRSLWRVSRFYAEESCGQCTPCREGTPWMTRILRKLRRAGARTATSRRCSTWPRASRPTLRWVWARPSARWVTRPRSRCTASS
jgi:NADH-quinone oxidoreductase subunit F